MKTVREATIGKALVRLLQVKDGYAGVVLRDVAIKFRATGPNIDEVWRQLHQEVAKTSPNFFGLDGAKARFLRIFPNGFRSAAYREHERDYKMRAKEKLGATVP